MQNLKQNLKFSGNNKALVALLLDVFENVTAPTMVPMQNKTTTTEFFIGEAELVVELVLQSRCGSCGSPHVMTTICNEGTGIVIDYTCTKGHAKVWKSATRFPGDVLPKADKIMCAAEVFAKGGYTHLENFLGFVGLPAVKSGTFYDVQNKLAPYVQEIADENERNVFADLKTRASGARRVLVDGAFPNRRAAKVGFATAMDEETGLIISSDPEFTTKETCAEKLEAVGLTKLCAKMEKEDLDVDAFCHDAKAEQKTIIKRTQKYAGSRSRLDLWHSKKTIMKNFTKALDKRYHSGRQATRALQTKNKLIREALQKMSSAVKSHLQYTLDHSKNCEQRKLEIWLNGPLHWKGDHSMCGTYNPEAPCVVEHSDRRHEILIGDDGVFDAVSEWMSLPEHKKLLANLEHGLATSIVESFNNMAASWADKRKFFGPTGISLRHNMAKLHWNNNRFRMFLKMRRHKVSPLNNKHKKRTERRVYAPMSFAWAHMVLRGFRGLCGEKPKPIAALGPLPTNVATVTLLSPVQ